MRYPTDGAANVGIRPKLLGQPGIAACGSNIDQVVVMARMPPSRCELILVNSLSVFGKKSRIGGSRLRTADPETFGTVDGRRRVRTLR